MGPADNNNGAKGFVIPKLAQDGSNWVTWKTQTLATLGSNKGVMRHLNGTVRVPDPLPAHAISFIVRIVLFLFNIKLRSFMCIE